MRYRLRTLLIVVTLACAACAYARLYFATVAYVESDDTATFRFYDRPWQVWGFGPAARVESLATGRIVVTGESEALAMSSFNPHILITALARQSEIDRPLTLPSSSMALKWLRLRSGQDFGEDAEKWSEWFKKHPTGRPLPQADLPPTDQ